MRRKEFAVQEQEEVEQFLQETSYGYLATTGEEGWPHLTPINFVYLNGHIYFHGSRKGSKMTEIAASKKVSFAVSKEYAIIPSYFTDPRQACPATSYFKSVHIRGEAEPADDLVEKAEVLAALMSKLQPEGGYAPITPDDPTYRAELKGVSVVRLSIQELTAKFKFGQNLKEERRESIIQDLSERGLPDDLETAELMRKYCPFHQESFKGD
ncbi:pyridoxamine 5'-phosphate oxidase family protein [Paenibacillus sp. SYP-B3998]|uniref:Pyridoxamine 5'-phosphate oxidase family protein n=1 Tax=Paenibacillus sp. SYP-B3998 TaxID=2678564 RepID=A0A6G4A2N1_9BACL|nr:pyridoxamine 5'-phosphate oxidase family protein [Paenibacillus sp. SYP-B3998]NEW08194.1 pyridoxamine 5'-phosphate oxidase family protein [Paenibacillus sp. SYP-B3998]